MHGGATPRGPDSPHFKHGKYANAFKGQFRAHYDVMMADGEPFELLSEFNAQRAMFTAFIEKVTSGRRVTFVQMETVIHLGQTVINSASKIIEARNKTAFTNAEVEFMQAGMKQILEKYVPDPDQRRAFIDDLRHFLPGWTDADGKAGG